MTHMLSDQFAQACKELEGACTALDPDQFDQLVREISGARKVVLHGVGREGLMMRALAMRLYHMGLDAHIVGDMSTPPVGPGDLLIVSAGPGGFSTVNGLLGVAKGAGARTACVTAQRDGDAPKLSDCVLVIPAQTMADDRADDQSPDTASILPMGSLFEGAQYLVFEVLILHLRDHLDVDPDVMRSRHTNLE